VNGAETKMTISSKARAAHRLIAGCAIAAAVTGGMRLAAAPAESVRLVGVSSQTDTTRARRRWVPQSGFTSSR